MAEEKKAYKKSKEREKSSLDKRKHDNDWKVESKLFLFNLKLESHDLVNI